MYKFKKGDVVVLNNPTSGWDNEDAEILHGEIALVNGYDKDYDAYVLIHHDPHVDYVYDGLYLLEDKDMIKIGVL